MVPLVITLVRAMAILVIEIVAFFFFYNHPHGRRAVYFSWYALVIDVLAILSGSVIMATSVYALHHPSLFTITVPEWMFWLVFIIGSWQATIHLVKILIRRRGKKDSM